MSPWPQGWMIFTEYGVTAIISFVLCPLPIVPVFCPLFFVLSPLSFVLRALSSVLCPLWKRFLFTPACSCTSVQTDGASSTLRRSGGSSFTTASPSLLRAWPWQCRCRWPRTTVSLTSTPLTTSTREDFCESCFFFSHPWLVVFNMPNPYKLTQYLIDINIFQIPLIYINIDIFLTLLIKINICKKIPIYQLLISISNI